MKTSRMCPKCRSRKLWVIERVEQQDCQYSKTNPLNVTAQYAPSGKVGLFGEETQKVEAGFFEAWVCAECGFTEWYARDVNQALAYLASRPNAKVHYLDAGAPSTGQR